VHLDQIIQYRNEVTFLQIMMNFVEMNYRQIFRAYVVKGKLWVYTVQTINMTVDIII